MIKKQAKQMVKRLFGGINSTKPESTSFSEKKLIDELKARFSELQHDKNKVSLDFDEAWKRNVYDLSEMVLNEDPRHFLRWDVILETMFVKNERYVFTELSEIKQQIDWHEVWAKAIEEVPIGDPIPFKQYPVSSGNLIHHAYHLCQFHNSTGIKAHKRDLVVEFGGGYGCMCRLLHKMGFNGTYILYDLPQFAVLQEFYLKSVGIPVYDADNLPVARNGVVCISDLDTLKQLLDKRRKENSLFIAMWSISEAPPKLRDSFLSIVGSFDACLMAYQDKFGEVDNAAYFLDYMKLRQHDIDCVQWPIRHLPGNSYLVGVHRHRASQPSVVKPFLNVGPVGYRGGLKNNIEPGFAERRLSGTFSITFQNVIKRVTGRILDIIQDHRHERDYRKWLKAGQPIPPPHTLKQMIVKQFARKHGIRIFVETGTYLGDMVRAIKNSFQIVYSIELSHELYERAKKKFGNQKHVNIVEGDSSEVLGHILDSVNEPCLLWLDGHYSEGITAKGKKETPILEELKAVLNHPIKNHVILIDDARCFTGKNEYPTIERLKELIVSSCPNYIFGVEHDIIRVYQDNMLEP